MRIFLETTSTNPEFNGNCDYAVVNMTPALAKQIRQRVKLARRAGSQDAEICEVYFWCGTAEFFDSGLVDACQEAVTAAADPAKADEAVRDWLADLEQNGHSRLPDGVDLGAYTPQRTECDQFILRTHFYGSKPRFVMAWMANPKHTDVYVTTRELPLESLEDYLRPAKKAPV